MGVANERRNAVDADMYLQGIHDVADPRKLNDAFPDILAVEFARCVLNTRSRPASFRIAIGVYPAGIPITSDGDEAIQVGIFQSSEFEIRAGGPVQLRQGEGGERDGGFEFGAVAAAVEVLEGGDGAGEDGALPGEHGVFEDAEEEVHWVAVEVLSYVGVLGVLAKMTAAEA